MLISDEEEDTDPTVPQEHGDVGPKDERTGAGSFSDPVFSLPVSSSTLDLRLGSTAFRISQLKGIQGSTCPSAWQCNQNLRSDWKGRGDN